VPAAERWSDTLEFHAIAASDCGDPLARPDSYQERLPMSRGGYPVGVRLHLTGHAPAIDNLNRLFLAQRPESRNGCKVGGSRARLAALPQIDRLPGCAHKKADFQCRQPQTTPVRCQSLGTESRSFLRRLMLDRPARTATGPAHLSQGLLERKRPPLQCGDL